MSYFSVNDRCTGCLACVHNCPAGALSFDHEEDRRILLHNIIACAKCGNCWRICPEQAVDFQTLLEGRWDQVVVLQCLKCTVCGEPVYTVAHQRTLKAKFGHETEPLCPLHKADVRADSWLRAAKSGTKPGGTAI